MKLCAFYSKVSKSRQSLFKLWLAVRIVKKKKKKLTKTLFAIKLKSFLSSPYFRQQIAFLRSLYDPVDREIRINIQSLRNFKIGKVK